MVWSYFSSLFSSRIIKNNKHTLSHTPFLFAYLLFFLLFFCFFLRFALCALALVIVLFQLSSRLLHDIAYVLTALIANIRFKSVEIKSKHDFKCVNTIKWLHLWYLVKGNGEDVCVRVHVYDSVCICVCGCMFVCLYLMKIKTNRIWQMYNYIDAFSTLIRQYFFCCSFTRSPF